jgi:pSer/pThr/pTyr-binding forkhead associated (FHA) protein
MTDNLAKPPSTTGATPAKRRPYGLRFISGKYTGGEFPLVPNQEIVVGRASDLQMVLVEDMVSRRHARIFWDGEQIQIEDLGSTNGTFVNGEKIQRTVLKEGDRVLIGTNILKVVAIDSSGPGSVSPSQTLENVAARRNTQATTAGTARTMSGAIDEIPLPDLLQLLHTSKKSGVLVVRTEDDVGKIYFRKGQIYLSVINDHDDVPPLKALFRLITWQQGFFDLEPPDETKFPNEIDVSVPELLMEGLRQLDEFNDIKGSLPNLRARVGLPDLLIPPLRELSPDELDVLQLVHNYGTIEAVFNKSLALDLDTAQLLVKLLKKKYISVRE